MNINCGEVLTKKKNDVTQKNDKQIHLTKSFLINQLIYIYFWGFVFVFLRELLGLKEWKMQITRIRIPVPGKTVIRFGLPRRRIDTDALQARSNG
ncbi:hypothetical protein TorRG33x02_258190 [Trema orientale]|uniref:Uncharacterized protein n=1 Tax=Trema orientale TaxID=63057 RepID=A0A2P5D9U2_TREOI|nr:hypothetical protein TorRG33x02_258190 [Trema orientale]